jgi:hypothetical protein
MPLTIIQQSHNFNATEKPHRFIFILFPEILKMMERVSLAHCPVIAP